MPQHARRHLTRRTVLGRTAVGGLALAGGAAIAGPLVSGADAATSTFGYRDDGNAYVVDTGDAGAADDVEGQLLVGVGTHGQ